ncbi:hypothetical protein [uncultured Pseudacidovorax sp.]|uniref:hypothetical protein n=1 Tax=uncultured Pseudacidovorax sp. TaxID=679313 RepID=UPI0025D0F57A|nr:hypothetical protein [uncultured Pseudacidovorax sp.]
MREDQKQRLADLQERLLDVFLDEADPVNWSGAGKLPSEMSPQQRGDRHWDKKGAAGTMMVLTGVEKLLANDRAALGRDPYSDADLDRQIDRAETEARRRADAALQKAAKGSFDAKVHGKAN